MALSAKALDEALWNHQITDANSRRQHLAEGARKKSPLASIETFQRWQRFAVIAKLAVVIVFDNPGLRCRGPIGERHPTPER
jgi:hypothetical protein